MTEEQEKQDERPPMSKGKMIFRGLLYGFVGFMIWDSCNRKELNYNQGVKKGIDEFVSQTDAYVNIHQFIKEEKYTKADSIIKSQLRGYKSTGTSAKEEFYDSEMINDSVFAYSLTSIDKQIKKINKCLEDTL